MMGYWDWDASQKNFATGTIIRRGRASEVMRGGSPLVWERLSRAGVVRGWQRPLTLRPDRPFSRHLPFTHLFTKFRHLLPQLLPFRYYCRVPGAMPTALRGHGRTVTNQKLPSTGRDSRSIHQARVCSIVCKSSSVLCPCSCLESYSSNLLSNWTQAICICDGGTHSVLLPTCPRKAVGMAPGDFFIQDCQMLAGFDRVRVGHSDGFRLEDRLPSAVGH